MPPFVVPTGTAQLASGAGYTSRVFDSNGSKTAFVADATTAGTFDLFVAGADGSSPVLVVPGQLNIEIQVVALSPDGTKLAYTADSALINGGYDLYVVDATAAAVPRQVSPLRTGLDMLNANLDVFSQVTWSADSKYVGFSADLTTDGISQAYVVDTTTTNAAVALLAASEVTAPSVGVRGTLQFDSHDNVYFRASGVGTVQFKLFASTPDGVTRTDLTTLAPPRTDTTIADIGSFGVSPDGTKIVLSADAPTLGAYDLYTATVGTTTAIKLTNLAGPGLADLFAPIWFSPDGTKVAVVATYLGARREPFVIPLDASGMHRLAAIDVACGNCDASVLQWTVDGAGIYAEGDLLTDNDTKLFRLDPAMTDQAPTLAFDVVAGAGDVANVIVRGTP